LSVFRNILLWCSENPYMKEKFPQYGFVKRAVKRFMPGEKIDDALKETAKFKELGIANVFTYLGENIKDLKEADQVTEHYIDAIDKIKSTEAQVEISLKLTQVGFDLSFDKTYENFGRIALKAKELNSVVWIDMEYSRYVDKTFEFYVKAKNEFENVGLCVQSYLYRTKDDLIKLFEVQPNIRLVKGAYNEPNEIAFERKEDNDENYFLLAKMLIDEVKNKNVRAAFATHDLNIIGKIENYAQQQGLSLDVLEFQMLYGIKSGEQLRLARDGYKLLVLISYGVAWFPWYMRRLAERPANVWFVLKNLFTR
jgi:proline dehydrogenase